MTSRERLMTDRELDRLLGLWFEEGAQTAPDRIAENAVAEVATVPQERDWIHVIQASFSGAPLAWAAGILALAVGLGVILGPRLIGEPTPSPSESVSPGPTESPGPSQTVDPNAHQSVTPVGTIDWTRVTSGRRIFPQVEAQGQVIGYEVDREFNQVGYWVSEDGITWTEAEPGTDAFWPSAIHAGGDTISVISPDGCGSMMGPASSREVYVKFCDEGEGDAGLYRLEGASWVELPIPAPHPPQADGIRSGSRRIEYVAAIDGDNWVAPSLYLVRVPWENRYGTFESQDPFASEQTRQSPPWPFWNPESQLTEIGQPGGRRVIAELEPSLVGGQIQFRDVGTNEIVASVEAALPGWTPEELLRAYRGWGLDDITFIVSRDGEISEVRPPWAEGEDWYTSGVMTTALGRYYAASYAVDGYATAAAHLWTSDDGATWRAAPMPPVSEPPEWVEVAGSDSQLILTMHDPDSVWVSSDGQSWTEIVIDPALAGMPTPTDFGWLMNAFDAAAISGDGVNWEAIDLPELPAEPSVSYINGLFFYGPEDAGNGNWNYWVGTLRD